MIRSVNLTISCQPTRMKRISILSTTLNPFNVKYGAQIKLQNEKVNNFSMREGARREGRTRCDSKSQWKFYTMPENKKRKMEG